MSSVVWSTSIRAVVRVPHRRQSADVLAYILNANAMPAGEMELPRRAGMLQQIVYQPRKPPGGQESRHDG